MWQVTIPALVAALAALTGVTLGALLEPFKLRAVRLARIRQDRADRSAKLIETAMNCRARLLSLNIIHRQNAAGKPPSGASEEDRLDTYRNARNDFRKAVALLELSGPDELAAAASSVRKAEDEFRAQRYTLDDDTSIGQDYPPLAVLVKMRELEEAVHEFARAARRYMS